MFEKIKFLKKRPTISITFKITLWYTTFIVILLSSIIGGTFLVSDQINENSGKKRLVNQVTDIAEGEERFYPFEEGITFSLYDKDGKLIAGSLPNNFDVKDFSVGIVSNYTDSNNAKYIYYDLEMTSSYISDAKYVRGVIQTSRGQFAWYIPYLITAGALVVILIIMYGGYLIIRSSLKPVRDMTKTAKDISDSADLTKRLALKKGNDEVHTLAVVFNEMLDSLERSSKREKQFSSDVSHELRTPISVIMAESEYGVKYTDTVDEAKESFEVIERQSKRMTTMINQILELSRLDSSNEIPKNSFNFSSKLKNTLTDYEKMFEVKNIFLNINIEENIEIFGNEVLLMRLVDNLLSNALKYATTRVEVTLAKRNSIILEVSDDGAGISDEEKNNIWNRFYKVDKSRTTTEDNSSGLGLAITKKIVELHNGKIAVMDNKPQGARFIVNL